MQSYPQPAMIRQMQESPLGTVQKEPCAMERINRLEATVQAQDEMLRQAFRRIVALEVALFGATEPTPG